MWEIIQIHPNSQDVFLTCVKHPAMELGALKGSFSSARRLKKLYRVIYKKNLTNIVKKWSSSCEIGGRRKDIKGMAAGCSERE